MKLGISLTTKIPVKFIKNSNLVEIKKFTEDEITHTLKTIRTGEPKSVSFHLQYLENGKYILPSVDDFSSHIEYFSKAATQLNPIMISFHFGLSSKSVVIDENTFVAVANGQLLSRHEIIKNIERNLTTLKQNFPGIGVLLENLEYIPEYISKGAYSYIQEANFFGENVVKWHKMGMVDGMVLDISHAIIASANHPFYNGYMKANEEQIDIRKLEDVKSSGYSEYLKSIDENRALESFKNYLSRLPHELIKEIHISGFGRLDDGTYVDAHLIPGKVEKLALVHTLNAIAESSEILPPIVLEYSREPERIPEILEDLKKLLDSL